MVAMIIVAHHDASFICCDAKASGALARDSIDLHQPRSLSGGRAILNLPLSKISLLL